MRTWPVVLAVVWVCGVSLAMAATCAIDGGQKKQDIDGFGFSTAWCGTLSTAKNNALYNTLGMSILRVRIDQDRHWDDETNNAKAAHAAGAIVLGSEWSPPPAWTTNGKAGGGSLQESHYADYASWLNQAIAAHKLDYISFQNEPDYNCEWCCWTAKQMYNFVAQYGSTLTKPIVFPESYHFDDAFADPVLNDANTVNKIAVVGGHIYGGGLTTHQNAINKGKRVWQTEHYIQGVNDISACMDIAKTVSDCMNNMMNAYLWWWVYDPDDKANLVKQDGTIFKNGYTLGQFAKFVRPGMKRVSSTYTPTSGVYVTAYASSSQLVIVAVNTGGSDVSQAFTLAGLGAVSSLSATRTSSSENMAGAGTVSVSGGAFTTTLRSKSVTTFVGSIGSAPSCSTPANPANGHFTCTADTCTAICDSGYAATGTGYSTCSGNSWSSLPACVPTGAGAAACGIADENKALSLSCESGKVLNAVEFASYGTPTGDCSASAISSCHAVSSLGAMQDACVGKASCSVSAANSVFGDPCSGTIKKLAVRAHCAAATSVCAAGSEWSTLKLACESGKTISGISFASYGTAANDCGSFAKSSCHAPSSLDVVQKTCVGKNSCSFEGGKMNGIFGDPCSGTGKQLKIQALCS